MFTKLALVFSIFVCASKGAVLLWSKNNFEVSPLAPFTDDTLQDLVQKLGYPEVATYKSAATLLPEFERFLEGYRRAYNPNGDISTDNATEIATPEDLALVGTKQSVDASRGNDVLSILMVETEREKREAVEADVTYAKGPILYRAKTANNVYSLVYSSQPLVLKTANSSVELGESILVTIDSKNSSLRLDASVPVNEEKFILQFFFTWQSTYWSVTTVKVKSTLSNNFSVTLVAAEPFSVPARFSYHCGGVTVYSDADKSTELLIYDMQVQPDSTSGIFGDVYDCVDFTTAPIWSGLLVTALLAVGLMVALIAISEIKTMDKFDTQKTKQLVITVAE